MASAMANIYFKLITTNPPRKNIEDIYPFSLREEVQKMLDEYNANKNAEKTTD